MRVAAVRGRRWGRLLASGLLLAAFTLMGAGRSPADVDEVGMVIVYTQDTNGYLQSCGCQGTAVTGLAQAVGDLYRLRAAWGERSLILDGGNLAADAGRGRLVWNALHRSQYDVVSFGPADAKWESEYWSMVAQQPLPVVAFPALGSGQAFPSQLWFVKQLAGRRIAVLSNGPKQTLSAAEVARLGEVLREAREQADVVVLVTYRRLSEERESLQRDYPGLVDLVIGARGSEGLSVPEQVGMSWLLPAALNGRQIGVVRLSWAGSDGMRVEYEAEVGKATQPKDHPQSQVPAIHAEVRAITSDSPTDAATASQVVEALMQEQEVAIRDGLESNLAALGEHGYVTVKRCSDCHQSEYATWQQSGHSRALKTLAKKDALRPECLACHAQSFRQTGQILPLAVTEQGVECTTCHDGALLHLALPQAGNIARGSLAQCRTCHTPDRDPDWDEARRWAAVEH